MEVEELPQLIENKDIDGIKQLMKDKNLSVVNGKIIANDKDNVEKLSEYFDMIQLVRKIGLNSIFGCLTNPGSNFFDFRLGSSCTLGGRKTCEHQGSKINELLVGKYELGEMVTYGDTDSCFKDAIISTENGYMTVEELFNNGLVFWSKGEKEYSVSYIKILHYDENNNVAKMVPYNYVYRHKVNKPRFRITSDNDMYIDVTGDHSIMILNDGLKEVKPDAINIGDTLITVDGNCSVKSVDQLDNFDNEYVYDVGVNGDPYFFANGILVHNSIYFTVPDDIKKTLTKESFIKLCDMIGDTVNGTFPEFYKNTFNVPPENSKVIKCAREICATSALFIKKKRYAALVYDEKNFRLDSESEGKLKIMGLDIKRADCPVWVQKKLKDTIDQILAKEKSAEQIIEFIRSWRNEFSEFPAWEMGIPKRVNKLSYYTDVFKRNTKGITIPGHVRASINWNNMLKEMGDINSMKITDGFKVIVCRLKTNNHGIESIAYPIDQNYLPDWFKSLPFDIDSMIEIAIDKKVENIFGVLDVDLSLTKINDADELEWE